MEPPNEAEKEEIFYDCSTTFEDKNEMKINEPESISEELSTKLKLEKEIVSVASANTHNDYNIEQDEPGPKETQNISMGTSLSDQCEGLLEEIQTGHQPTPLREASEDAGVYSDKPELHKVNKNQNAEEKSKNFASHEGAAASSDGAEAPPDDHDESDASSESDNEEGLTEAEIAERQLTAKKKKEDGNEFYKNSNYTEAEKLYTEGLNVCPRCLKKERSVMYSNRSACLMKLEKTEEAIKDCTKALNLHPTYLKALLRRAQLYEKLEKYEEATKDYEGVLTMDPSVHAARAALLRLPEEIEKRNEKLKKQMMSSLKDLGNLFLRPFGLSTDNFQMQQDPNSGSYNIQFNNTQNNSPGNNGPNRR